MYPSVLQVVPNEDFTLAVVFDNGEHGILEREYEDFKCVRVASDAIEWDSGVDLDPEFVYGKCTMTTHA